MFVTLLLFFLLEKIKRYCNAKTYILLIWNRTSYFLANIHLALIISIKNSTNTLIVYVVYPYNISKKTESFLVSNDYYCMSANFYFTIRQTFPRCLPFLNHICCLQMFNIIVACIEEFILFFTHVSTKRCDTSFPLP